MGLSIGFLQQHHPFARFGAANQITTLRAILVALVAGLVGEPRVPAVAVAAVGRQRRRHAARRRRRLAGAAPRIASRFGARFDMEIDALLILALSVLAWRHDKAGAWVVAVRRCCDTPSSRPARWRRGCAAPLPPSRRRQTICVIQIAALTLVMLPAVEPPVSTVARRPPRSPRWPGRS